MCFVLACEIASIERNSYVIVLARIYGHLCTALL